MSDFYSRREFIEDCFNNFCNCYKDMLYDEWMYEYRKLGIFRDFSDEKCLLDKALESRRLFNTFKKRGRRFDKLSQAFFKEIF